jgi:hypothetical protein
MKRAVLVLAVLFAASASDAQISRITTDRNGNFSGSGFSIGPRISNYSTKFDTTTDRVRTGRQSSFGVAGDYRSGQFVLDFNWDHDPEDGFEPSDLVVDTGNYERDRWEVMAGYALAPVLDIQGGLHYDDIRLGGASFFGNPIFNDLQIEHTAIAAGLKLHTGDRAPFGFYALARGFVGTADISLLANADNPDTTGFRAEGGISFRLGDSNWYAVPGLEYERVQSDDDLLDFKSNRVFVNVIYRSN